MPQQLDYELRTTPIFAHAIIHAMVPHQLLLFVHIFGVMLLVAGVGASVACKSCALRSSSPEVVHEMLRTASRAVRVMSMPGSMLLMVAGLGLVYESHGGYSLMAPWTLGAAAAWLASAAVGVHMHGPRSRAARALALELVAAGGSVTPRLSNIVRGGRAATVIDVTLLAAMLSLMVFKPG